jgi:hypothetical protein
MLTRMGFSLGYVFLALRAAGRGLGLHLEPIIKSHWYFNGPLGRSPRNRNLQVVQRRMDLIRVHSRLEKSFYSLFAPFPPVQNCNYLYSVFGAC